MFISKKQLEKCVTTNIDVSGETVNCSPIIKYLRAWLDQHMQLHDHIMKKCRTAMMNLQKIKFLCSLLTQESAHTLVRGLINSHLDYCNVIFTGLPKVLLKILQKFQNIAAKLVLGYNKYESSITVLWTLHWLPIKKIDFKILPLVHKCLSGLAPEYLKDSLIIHQGGREGLCSAKNSKKLITPKTYYKTFANRPFSIYWPQIWNALLSDIQEIEDLEELKKRN